MSKLEQAARQALADLERDHKSEQVMVNVNFLRQVEQLLIEFKMGEEYEWGNCRPLEVMEEKKLLPKEVYQIRKILEEAPVFGFTQAHTSDKPLHHYALVLRDLDKTVEGWCEEPEFYFNGERLYAATVRTKDLTDDEIRDALKGCEYDEDTPFEISEARAVIAAEMNRKEIIKLAVDIDGHMNDYPGGINLKWDTLVKIVQKAIKDERDACAELCTRMGVGSLASGFDLGPWDCAEQIKARG